jgi:hypothetical protein
MLVTGGRMKSSKLFWLVSFSAFLVLIACSRKSFRAKDPCADVGLRADQTVATPIAPVESGPLS